MMVGRWPAALCLLLLIAAPDAFGQDEFNLADAFDEKPTEKPQQPQPGIHDMGHTGSDAGAGGAGGGVTEKKPTMKPQPAYPDLGGGDDGGFDLRDVIGEDEKKPSEKPRRDQPGEGGRQGGNFGDDDLADAAGGMHPHDPSGPDSKPHGGEEGGQGQGEGEKQSIIAGVLSTLGVAAVGFISSFIAYQKKKLCFKGQADDPENVNMDPQKGDPNDPQAQSSLLAK